MAKVGIEVKGATELARRLRRLGDKELRNELKEAWREGAEEVLSGVRGVPHRTGALMATVRATATVRSGRVSAGNRSSVKYAGPIHWGWPARGIKASPFLVDALARREPSAVEIVSKRVEEIAAKVTEYGA